MVDADDEPAHAASRRAFGALLLRDLVVLRKNLKEFLPRTLLQPFLLVFVFTYVFPKIGQGVGGSGRGGGAVLHDARRRRASALAIMFQGIQAVALPMVQEFGYTREIEDRVLAPLPVRLVAIAEDRRRAHCNGLFAALARVPDRRDRAATPVHLQINWPVLLTLRRSRATCAARSA